MTRRSATPEPIRVPRLRPRNPQAVAARQRAAGPHARGPRRAHCRNRRALEQALNEAR